MLEFNNPMRDTDVAAATRLWLLPEKQSEAQAGTAARHLPLERRRGGRGPAQSSPSRCRPPPCRPSASTSQAHSLQLQGAAGPLRLSCACNRGLKAFGGFILGKPFAHRARSTRIPAAAALPRRRRAAVAAGRAPRSAWSRATCRARGWKSAACCPSSCSTWRFDNYGSFAAAADVSGIEHGQPGRARGTAPEPAGRRIRPRRTTKAWTWPRSWRRAGAACSCSACAR